MVEGVRTRGADDLGRYPNPVHPITNKHPVHPGVTQGGQGEVYVASRHDATDYSNDIMGRG